MSKQGVDIVTGVRWAGYSCKRMIWAAIVIILSCLCGVSVHADATPSSYVIRFSDEPQAALLRPDQIQPATNHNEVNPQKKVNEWFSQNDFKGAYPMWAKADGRFWFAGPPGQRYLRVQAQDAYFIFVKQLDQPIHLNERSILEIVWAVDTFPDDASMGVYNRQDRAVVVVISFGDKVRGNWKNVPRGLAFYWNESDTIGQSYTCIKPEGGPPGHQQACTYPHVKYIPLQKGHPKHVKRDRVNLTDAFKTHFRDYTQQNGLPPITAISIESRSDLTESTAASRLYSIAFHPPE